jgi:membrane associated rhomboid family serine protease
MIGLYLFGPIVEAHFGGQRYLAFYLLCGLAGAGCFVGMWAGNVLQVHPATPLVGASAGIFGLLVASAMIAPDVQIVYYFFPVTIFMVAVAAMLMAAYTVLASGWNAAGESAHLGGGIFGFVLMKNQQWLAFFAPSQRRGGSRRRVRRVQKDWSRDFNR